MRGKPMRDEARQKIEQLAKDVCEAHGCEVFLIDFKEAGKRSRLCVFIDHEDGVNVETCRKVSQELSVLLDVEDPIAHPYTLEVSSPGINRPLRGPADFEKYVGRTVKVVTREAIGDRGQTTFIGKLIGYEDETATIQAGKSEARIAQDNIKRANLEFEF